MRAGRGEFVVFAKVPEPGKVKTRLQPAFTAEQAAEFYAEMLADVLAATAEIARGFALAPVLALHPWAMRAHVHALVPPAFRVVPQRGANLAARMAWAIREAAAGGAERILLRGSDSPTLDSEAVAEVLTALEVCDLSLRPDRDGGYGLVGVVRPVPGLFDHAMSSASVLADTLANAAARDLRVHVGRPGFDLDTVGDLVRLAQARTDGRARGCARTLAYLDDHDLWSSSRPRAE
jgi:hypothetical protein